MNTTNESFPLDQLAGALLSDNNDVRLFALARLEDKESLVALPEDVIRSLLACLGYNTKKIQRDAATILVRFAPQQPGIIEALVRMLTDSDSRLRWTAAFALSQLDLPTPSPLPVLIENLGHQESDLRWAAATAVLQLAQQHPQDIVAAMIQLIDAGNAVQRRMALYCLRDLEQAGDKAQDVYLTSLKDEDPMVRLGGLSCLGKLQLTSRKIREALIHLLEHDADMGVRRSAAVTCGQVGDAHSDIVKALHRTSESEDSSLAKASAGALRELH